MDAGLVGGIAGGVIGLMGGIVGTIIPIFNVKSSEERHFVIMASIVLWVSIISFLLLLYITPQPFNFLWWIPYSIFLPIVTRMGNRRQMEIRAQHAQVENA